LIAFGAHSLAPAFCPKATDPERALLAVENVADGGVVTTRNLVRHRFRNGEYAGKDVLLSREQSFFGHAGGNHITHQHYVVTKSGSVIDLERKAVLNEFDGHYVGEDGDRVIVRTRDDPARYFAYDLRARQFQPLTNPGRWALPGVRSPDGTKSVAGRDGRFIHDEIWLYRPDGARERLGSGFLVQLSPRSSLAPRTPVLWLDDSRILTQRANGELVLLNLDKTTEPVVTVRISERPTSSPTITRDPDGRVLYRCGDEEYAIDVAGRTSAPFHWLSCGHGFEFESRTDPGYGHAVRYRGREIGRLWCSPRRARTTEGFVAVEYGPLGSNLGHPQGLKVWSSQTEKWTTLDGWVNDIIGWIDGRGQ
jgi:hypothetical protein